MIWSPSVRSDFRFCRREQSTTVITKRRKVSFSLHVLINDTAVWVCMLMLCRGSWEVMCHKNTLVSAGSVVQTETVRFLLFQLRHLFIGRLAAFESYSSCAFCFFFFVRLLFWLFLTDFVPSILRTLIPRAFSRQVAEVRLTVTTMQMPLQVAVF